MKPRPFRTRRRRSGEVRSQQQGPEGGAVAQKEVGQRLLSDVDGEELAKERGARGEDGEDAAAQARPAIEEQEESGHLLR